ncbi:DUF3422 domain-containing protein [Limnobacter sp.]|uniref:DUF3422 family protein n=1 Tax=Limnobacter sp. TaxID=2003368 RepID=UPI00258B8D51|nr:DUF3422 domain-containing protein [Limnobacter sp.]
MNKNKQLPEAYPLRQSLNDEVHSRPTEVLWPQERVFHIALLVQKDVTAQIVEQLKKLIDYCGCPEVSDLELSAPQVNLNLNLGEAALRLRLEKHNEFISLTFFERADHAIVFDRPVTRRLPPSWLATLPGVMLVAIELFVQKTTKVREPHEVAGYFDGNTLIGGMIANGAGQAFSDLRIADRGATRILICNLKMGSRQLGRVVQRLIEMETYRMMALLSFPVARSAIPKLTSYEEQLVRLATDMSNTSKPEVFLTVTAEDLEMDRQLLSQLTDLAAKVEQLSAENRMRFTAAEAYTDLVKKRITELKELPMSGMQTFGEFMDRRLAPAMKTCTWTARRQDELAARISRITQLLRTRVEIERESQNHRLLTSMDRRAKLQLRLQETVEGLSVVAISYYGASVCGYIAKGLKELGILHISPEIVIAVAIPCIAITSFMSLHAMKKRLGLDEKHD